MVNTDKIFTNFSYLFAYPEVQISKNTEELLDELILAKEPKVVEMFKHFHDFVKGSKFSAVEELFTITFDLNPACCLEIGWHLFGEDYRRGEFLVLMRQSLAEEKLNESTELPDHLSHCLQLLAKLELEDARAFSKSFILPSLEKIQTGLQSKESNPYTELVDALIILLKSVYEINKTQQTLPNQVCSNFNFHNSENGVVNNCMEKCHE
ncbi:hypothetical protein IT568_12025 [bacterium]|nr:hypothetical protein [bacterium]